MLTTHVQLAPTLRMNGADPPLPPICLRDMDTDHFTVLSEELSNAVELHLSGSTYDLSISLSLSLPPSDVCFSCCQYQYVKSV